MNLLIALISFLLIRADGLVFPVTRYKIGLYRDHREINELITFHLWNDKYELEELIINNVFNLAMSSFDKRKRTKFIVHDWLDDIKSEWIQDATEAMARTKKWNVILVNWSPLSYTFYTQANDHVSLAAESLANFTIYLNKHRAQPLRSFHYVAHGHGIRISSRAADFIKREFSVTGRKIYRITALDPLKELIKKNDAVDGDDVVLVDVANFVDVIHTSGSTFGNMMSMGHVDYYPNGGTHQPNCDTWYCDHTKAYEYWKNSIEDPRVYKAYNYKSWDDFLDRKLYKLIPVPMGIGANKLIPPGNYYLET